MHTQEQQRSASNWTVIETFERGNARAEVSMLDGYTPKYSMRIGWKEGEKTGAWFPYREESTHSDDIAECVKDAEAFIIGKIGEYLKKTEEDLAMLRTKQDAKRKQYESNVERRKEENRQRAKGGKR